MHSLEEIKKYSPPRLHTDKEWYISFKAFGPSAGKLRLKRIKINYIRPVTERRKYAKDLIMRLSEKLVQGWNPWIEAEHSSAYISEHDLNRLMEHLEKNKYYLLACYILEFIFNNCIKRSFTDLCKNFFVR